MKLIPITIFAVLIDSAALAAPCAITGESIDADPKGLRVHAAASMDSAEVGRLYPGMDPEAFYHEEKATLADGLVGAMFTVDRVKDEWLHIAEIDPVTDGIDPTGGLEMTRNFQGAGWVHASRVRLSPARWEEAYAEPSEGSARVDDSWHMGRIVNCRGSWAQVRSGASQGWLRSQPNTERAAKIRQALNRAGAEH